MAWSDAARAAALEVRRRHTEKWADAVKKRLGLQNFDVYTKGDVLNLAVLRVRKQDQGLGKGSQAMTLLVRHADKGGMRVALSPAPVGGSGLSKANKAKLVKFYSRYGFKSNLGRHADLAISETMIRTPILRRK